jgi:D-sedoheptulose 7-phosphate isomerase
MTSNDRNYIEGFFSDLKDVIEEVSIADIEQVIQVLFDAWQRGSTVFLIGNGGSAGTASHFAADLCKCTVTAGKLRLKASSLTDNIALFSAITNDNGWENVFTEQLMNFFKPKDVLIALSVHGGSGSDQAGPWSQNLLKAIKFANDNDGVTVGLSGFDGGALKQAADYSIVVPINSTAHVESFHVVLHHLIAFRLAEKIKAAEAI